MHVTIFTISEIYKSVNDSDIFFLFVFSVLTLLVWQQEGHPACKKVGVGLLVVMN